MLLNDSLAYRYDYLRLKSLELDLDETIEGAEKYRRYHEFIEYAGSIGDDATVAMISIQLGNLLGDIGEFEQGCISSNCRTNSTTTRAFIVSQSKTR